MNTSTQTADRWLIRAAWAGIIGPILFFLTWVAQELFLTEGYSPLEQPVSALAAWPHGLVQTVNFVVFGLLTFAFAIGLHRGLAPSRFGIVGPALFAVTGLGLLWAAAFPLRSERCRRSRPWSASRRGRPVLPGQRTRSSGDLLQARPRRELGTSGDTRAPSRDPSLRGFPGYDLPRHPGGCTLARLAWTGPADPHTRAHLPRAHRVVVPPSSHRARPPTRQRRQRERGGWHTGARTSPATTGRVSEPVGPIWFSHALRCLLPRKEACIGSGTFRPAAGLSPGGCVVATDIAADMLAFGR